MEPLLVSSLQRRYSGYIAAHGKTLKPTTGMRRTPVGPTGNCPKREQPNTSVGRPAVWMTSRCVQRKKLQAHRCADGVEVQPCADAESWIQHLAFHQRLNNPLQPAHTVPTQRIIVFIYLLKEVHAAFSIQRVVHLKIWLHSEIMILDCVSK